MKNINTLITLLILVGLLGFGCNRNQISNQSFLEKKYKAQSLALEGDYAAENVNTISASPSKENPNQIESPAIENNTINKVRYQRVKASFNSNLLLKSTLETTSIKSNKLEVKHLNQKSTSKTIKEYKTEKLQQRISIGLRNGIIVGAIGLLLIVVAGFFGAAAPIIYVAGAVLFIVGIVIILLDVI